MSKSNIVDVFLPYSSFCFSDKNLTSFFVITCKLNVGRFWTEYKKACNISFNLCDHRNEYLSDFKMTIKN